MSSRRSSKAVSLSGTPESVYSPPSSWKAEIGCRPTVTGNHILVASLNTRAEVQRVGVVQAHLGERPGAGMQERVIAVIVEGKMHATSDATREVLQTFQKIRFGFDMRCRTHQLFGFGDGVEQWL